MPSVSRRLCLTVPAGLALIGASAAPPVGTAPRPLRPSESGLHARAQRKGLFYGSAIDATLLRTDATYMAHVPQECGVLVGEAAFKWAELRPSADTFSFERADMLVAYAARHGLRARGHALVWHESVPEWLEHSITPANAEALLVAHIARVAGHFRRRLIHWDVVNEPIRIDDGRPDGLRDTLWLRALGTRYFDIAFHACAAADPSALRVLNEYGTDYAVPAEARRREALLKLLSDLKARGVPVQAVGLQGHLDAAQTALDQTVLSSFVRDITGMGLKVIVTELDVRDNGLPADVPSRDQAVADHARAWLDAVLVEPAVLGVLSWGLSDRRSWLNDKFPRPDKLPQRPLPLDANLQRKKLWTAIGAALEAAPSRRI